jgi:hypothetical protein
VFVWGLWAGLFAAALAFVLTYGPPFPRWDDFAMVPAITGGEPVTAGWLWSLHNEHRLPLPKLTLLGLLRLSGGDFRAGMVFSAAALAALALGMIVTARRRSGGWRETDAVFPLVLLNLGHHANLLWAWQVQFILSTVLAGGFLLLVVARRDWPRSWATALAGALLALMPLCGANGLALVPALTLWLLVSAAAQARRGDVRAGLGNLAASAPALAVVVLYLRGYRAAAHHTAGGGLTDSLATGLQFLSLTFGPSAATLWPHSGLAVAVGLVASVGLLVRVAAVRPGERPRALGLLAVLGGLGSLAAGLGWGRAGATATGGFEPRYVTLAAPLGCALYFIWDLYGGPPALRRLVPLGLFAAMLVVLWPDTQAGLDAGRGLARESARLRREVRSGAPMFVVIKEATPFLHPSQDALAEALPRLRDAGFEDFRALRPDPPFREVTLPLTPTDVRLARWERGTAYVEGVDPQLTFTLPADRYVAGIRLRYSHANGAGAPARFKLDWLRTGQSSPPPTQRFANWNLPTGRDRTTTVWVGDVLREIQIHPDNRTCEFTLGSITLLVPAGEPPIGPPPPGLEENRAKDL